ncbi:MAG: ROK family protein [Micromonosporaceae bacterium]
MQPSSATDRPDRPDRPPTQPGDLRRQNVSAVMRTVLARGSVARADIATVTGLARGSVTKLTAGLMAAGLLREESPVGPSLGPGRPRVPVVIDPTYRVIGVHVGLLWTIVGVVDLAGRIVDEVTLRHRDASFEEIVELATGQIGRFTSGQAGRRIIGVGASAGGWVDPATGVVVEHQALGWKDAPLRAALAERLTLPVVLDGTVRAIALAESWFGAATDVRSLLHVFVGNIVGAGIVVDRRLHLGPGAAAGYLDHVPVGARTDRRCRCGRSDCLDAVASDVAVVADARAQGILGPHQTIDDLAALAREGHERATGLLRERARHVGHAIALLVEILNPERVMVGGGVADHPEYLPDLHRAFAERMHHPLHTDPAELVRPTSFGRHAVMLASATAFLDAYYRDPMAYPPLAGS